MLPLDLASGLAGYRFTFVQGHSAFLANAAQLAFLFPKMSSALLLVTDYMCLIQEAFPAIRFELRFSFCFFILNLNFILLTKESCLKKDSLGILFFYEILLTNWGLICVRRFFLYTLFFPIYKFDSV